MGQEKSQLAALVVVVPLLSVAQYQRGQGAGGSGRLWAEAQCHCDLGGALSGGLRGLHRKLN